MKNSFGIWILSFVIFLLGCGIKRTPNSCVGAICTADFRMLTVVLKDSMGNNFIPDKVETYLQDTTLIAQSTQPTIPGQNMYTVIDDSHKDLLEVNTDKPLTFKIYKGGQVVKQQGFIAKADCCHIMKVSGADTVVVD